MIPRFSTRKKYSWVPEYDADLYRPPETSEKKKKKDLLGILTTLNSMTFEKDPFIDQLGQIISGYGGIPLVGYLGLTDAHRLEIAKAVQSIIYCHDKDTRAKKAQLMSDILNEESVLYKLVNQQHGLGFTVYGKESFFSSKTRALQDLQASARASLEKDRKHIHSDLNRL